MSSEGSVQGKRRFIAELQSLRGMAALLVLVHHCGFYYTYDASLKKIFEVAFNAHAAVVLFYVLSGFVLFIALENQQASLKNALRFYLRRGFRMFPALWLACGLALVYLVAFADHPFGANVSAWFEPNYRNPHPSPIKVILAFFGASHALPIPMWSITIELVASALMPLIVLSTRHWGVFAAATLGLLWLSFAGGMGMPMYVGGYLVDFMAGAWLARWGVPLLKALPKQVSPAWVAGLGLLGLNFARQLGGWNYNNYYHNPSAALLECLFAMAFVGAIAARPEVFGWMRAPRLIALGDISYSLYLLHLPVLALVAGVAGDMLGLPGFSSPSGVLASVCLLGAVLPITLWLAAASYRFVELPGIALGRKAVARFA